MRYYILCLFYFNAFFLSQGITGQTLYTEPAFPVPGGDVTVFFNATGTALEGYSGDVYTHTGVTVNGVQWQYVIGNWGDNGAQPKLTKVGNQLYSLELTPSIRDFYGVPEGDLITEMCFVFRAESGSPQSSDLFADVYQDELNVIIQSPANTGLYIEETDAVEVLATSPLADSMFLYVDGMKVYAAAGITLEYTLPASMLGELWAEHWVTVKAKDATGMAEASFSAVPVPQPPVAALPEGVREGINYPDSSTAVLVLYAPLKRFTFATGEFNSWIMDEASFMNRTPDELRYWIQLEGLEPGKEYAFQYVVDGSIRITDPYSELILDPWNDAGIPEENYPGLKPYPVGQEGLVSVLQTNAPGYTWQITDFEPPAITDLVVYELLIRDFLQDRNFKTLTDTLGYLKRLGVNAIELMPVNEFDGNNSWGYNPNHYFAVDKYYGKKNDLKAFIDACHGAGMAVILDVVYNHATGQSPYVKLYWDSEINRPSVESPFYNEVPRHDFNVFNDMNHESEDTRQYISRAVRFWLEEFRVDGYRFDLSKGFTQKNTLGNSGAMAQYDQDRIDILTAYADTAWAVNPKAYIILEHFAENDEEKVLSDHGCMLWGNANYNFNEATMGYHDGGKSDFSWISYQKRGWSDPHVMGYMESHDEERLMAKNLAYGNAAGIYNVKELNVALKRIQLAAAFFFSVPGPKMIWEFGEVGYEYHINYPGQIGQDDHRTDPKPVLWFYAEQWNRKALYNVFRELITLKTTEPAFETSDYTLSVSSDVKTIHLNHSTMNVTVLGNFNVIPREVEPGFQHTGYWYDYFAGDSIFVTDVAETIQLDPGAYRIYTDKKFARPDIGLAVNDLPADPHPFRVYPNPSGGVVYISFKMKERGQAGLRIFNKEGQLVRDFGSSLAAVGDHTLQWDGISDAGNKVSQGIYLCELTRGGARQIMKLIIH